MIPQEIKKYMKHLGDDFANKKSREELYRLINNFLHKNKTDNQS